jgi:hypothetical protein
LSEFFRAGAVGATLLVAAMTVASPAAGQNYHPGQVCWPETPCPGYSGPGSSAEARLRAAAQRLKLPPRARAKKSPAAASERRVLVPASLSRPAVSPSEPRVYRYPTMYRAEAPPLLPPAARSYPPYAQQPYVLVSQGIWYWPGATDFKMPQVPGFEPLIDPSRVISW